jgi:hypothetical protein
MALVVPCPSCDTKLKAAEALAGKSARCPTCGTVLQLPATASSSRSQKDDDPDSRSPRPRKKPQKKRQGRGVPLWAVLVFGGIVFVGIVIGGSLLAYVLLGSKEKDNPSAPNSQAGSSPSAPLSGAATGGTGVKYVPRESEKRLTEYMKQHEHERLTDEQVFALMGEPTRRDPPITANKNGQVVTVYKAYWEVPGSGVTSSIVFANGRESGAIIGLEVKPSGSANNK